MSDKLPPRILVVEADEGISTAISNAVERYWFDVIKANNEESALQLAASNIPNIIVISSRIKNISALEMAVKLCKLPKMNNTPVIFLINEEENPNHYNLVNPYVEILRRPFNSDLPNLLMKSIKSLLRKSQPVFHDKIIKYKDVSIDLATYKVYKNGEAIRLGPKEFLLSKLFMKSPKVIFSREDIIQHVWDNDKTIEPRTVDVHVNRLRKALKNNKFIQTIRSKGYCLSVPGERE